MHLITITRTSGYMGIGMLTFSVVCHDSPPSLFFARDLCYIHNLTRLYMFINGNKFQSFLYYITILSTFMSYFVDCGYDVNKGGFDYVSHLQKLRR